jgi:hypothetical protein
MSSRGTPVSDETIEIIKATFAETGNLRAAARAANCSQSTAKKYAQSRDEFEQVRAVKRLTLIDHIAIAQVKLIDAMTDPDKLAKSSLHDIGVAFGIVTDKGLLLTGQATSRSETIGRDPGSVLTPEEMELAARVREKLAAQ